MEIVDIFRWLSVRIQYDGIKCTENGHTEVQTADVHVICT